MFLLFALAIWLFIAFVTGALGASKGQPFSAWFVVGALFGPLGLVAACIARRRPDDEVEAEAEWRRQRRARRR